MLQSMGKSVLKPFALVAAAVLALAMLLSACGAFDLHAAASDESSGPCCASLYGPTAAAPTDAATTADLLEGLAPT